MHGHATAFTIGAFVLGLLLLPTLRWVDAAWFAILSKVFDSQDESFPDEEEDDYRRFLSANDAPKDKLSCDEMSAAKKPRVTPR
jgi:hypothetical protein